MTIFLYLDHIILLMYNGVQIGAFNLLQFESGTTLFRKQTDNSGTTCRIWNYVA